VVAVAAILAAIAYPSYQEHVRKSRRTEAKALLLEAQARQEQFYTENNVYAANMTALGYGNNNEPTEENWYTVAVSAVTNPPANPTFTLTATRQGDQIKDARCGNLTVNSFGQKGETGSGTAQDCW
jgi:type IV pilus assembly protein PilE